MSKTAYNISLKGYVGGADFDRKAIDSILANRSGKCWLCVVGASWSLSQRQFNRGIFDFGEISYI